MPPTPTPAAVVFVADVQRVSSFYRELASMRVLAQDPTHCVLEIDGFQLTIHALRGEPSAATHPNGAVSAREDTYIKLCFPVGSIAAARALAATLGGSIKPAKHEWEARGFRACDGQDPEGNVIQVREMGPSQ
jgi:hypothetical protein